MKNGTLAIGDFKSSRDAFPSQFLQLGGYSLQIKRNGLFSKDGEHQKKLDKPISSLIVVPFGMTPVVPQIRYSVAEYEEGFKAAVKLYRLLGFEGTNN